MSKLSERRYRRKGLDGNQRQIVASLEPLGLLGVWHTQVYVAD
jgi:hypothetical protein